MLLLLLLSKNEKKTVTENIKSQLCISVCVRYAFSSSQNFANSTKKIITTFYLVKKNI